MVLTEVFGNPSVLRLVKSYRIMSMYFFPPSGVKNILTTINEKTTATGLHFSCFRCLWYRIPAYLGHGASLTFPQCASEVAVTLFRRLGQKSLITVTK